MVNTGGLAWIPSRRTILSGFEDEAILRSEELMCPKLGFDKERKDCEGIQNE